MKLSQLFESPDHIDAEIDIICEQHDEQIIFEAARDAAELKRDYLRWKKLTNLSSDRLRLFLDTPEGREAGLSRKEARRAGNIKTGRSSAHAILRMREKSFQDWTTADINWMYRQISFISRMSKMRGPLFKENREGKKIPTRKLTSLLVWGHCPPGVKVRFTDGQLKIED